MDVELRRVERLLGEQSAKLGDLKRSHADLTDALVNLRKHHDVKNYDDSPYTDPPRMPSNHVAFYTGSGPATPSSGNGSFPRCDAAPAFSEASPSSALDSRAVRVLAAAHEHGHHLSDLAGLSDEAWELLGATAAERSTVLGALQEWRRNLPGGGAPAPSGLCMERAGAQLGVRDHLSGAAVMPELPNLHGHQNDGAYGEDGLERGIGHGKRHFDIQDHLAVGAGALTAVGDGPGAHGRARANDISDGHFPRGIGHGKSGVDSPAKDNLCGAGVHIVGEQEEIQHQVRNQMPWVVDHIRGGTTTETQPGDLYQGKRYIAAKDHIWGGTAADDAPGSHGHGFLKDKDYEGGLMRCIGHGKRYFGGDTDHIQLRGNFGTAFGDKPGSFGHPKDDDFQDCGLQRGIGHGKRHHVNGLEAVHGAAGTFIPRTVGNGQGNGNAKHRSPSAPSSFGASGGAGGGGAPVPVSTPSTPASRAAGLPSRYANMADAGNEVAARLLPARAWW